MKNIDIYTDGACSGNPGPGGYGAIIIYKDNVKEISGFEPDTTNNRMELKAASEALKLLKEACNVNLYSDSAYLVNAFNEGWIYGWVKNGWRTSKKEEVKNIDLWQEILEKNKEHKITFVKVKGHSDNEYNNRCDFLATTAITSEVEKEVKKNEVKQSVRKDTADNYTEKLLSEKLAASGGIVDFYKAEVELPDGKKAKRDIIKHPGASVIVPVTNDGYMYLVRQFRTPVGEQTLEIPAGKLDKGEDSKECARRELEEETGFRGKLTHISSYYSTPGFSNEILHMYLATNLEQDKSHPDADEFISTEKYKIEDLLSMIIAGKIIDAKTIIGILIADRYLKGTLGINI